MRLAQHLALGFVALSLLSAGCSDGGSKEGGGNSGNDAGAAANDAGATGGGGGQSTMGTGGAGGPNSTGGSDTTGGGNDSTGGGSDGGSTGASIAASVKKAVAELQSACERIAARNVECGAIGKGDTQCAALTAGWFSSDLGFGPEVPDLSKLDDGVLRAELGVDEAKCKADCAEAAECVDVIAEAQDGACDGAANYTGTLDACRDTCKYELTGYACGDGQFVDGKAVCDTVSDCTNGHDELCTTDTFDCGGVTIMHPRASDQPKWDPTCDGKVQCDTTGKDEKGCEHEAFECIAGEFVAFDDVCNGKDDCTNAADEADCSEFDCGDGTRIPARGVCDSDTNCANHSDDLDCPG